MKRHSRAESGGKISDLEKHEEKLPHLDSPKKRKRDKHNIIKDYLIDYTANSNLHGLKYIGEKERTPLEKIFWLFMFICCVVLCAGLIRKVWTKWNESPVIVSFAENTTPVWQIPYPAVTLCFETKAMQTKFNFTEYYHLYNGTDTRANLTTEDRNMFEDLTLVCDDYLASPLGRKYSNATETVENIKSRLINANDLEKMNFEAPPTNISDNVAPQYYTDKPRNYYNLKSANLKKMPLDGVLHVLYSIDHYKNRNEQ